MNQSLPVASQTMRNIEDNVVNKSKDSNHLTEESYGIVCND
jgi:hypothetical protein